MCILDKEIVDLLTEVPKVGLNTSSLILGLISAIITIVGLMASIFKRLFQEINLINENKYTLVHRIHDESFIEYLKKWARWAYESFIIAFNIFLLYGITWLYVFFVNIRLTMGDLNMAMVIFMVILIVIAIRMEYIRKIRLGMLWEILKKVMDTCFLVILVLMFTSFLLHEKRVIMLVLMFAYIVAMMLGLSIFSGFGMYNNCKCRWIKISRVIRYAGLIVCSLFWLFQNGIDEGMYKIVFAVWQIWCIADGIVIRMTDDTNISTVTLHTKDGVKNTRDKIIQHKNNKIEYKLLDGKKTIVDDEQIEKITYQTCAWFCKNSRMKYRVEYVGRDGEITYCHNYQIIKGDWYVFSRREEGVFDIVVMKVKDVRTVTKESVL